MNRQQLEKEALDLVAGRAATKPVPKQQMSSVAKISIWLWVLAVIVIGGLAAYVYLLK
jgi:hypothetical protein